MSLNGRSMLVSVHFAHYTVVFDIILDPMVENRPDCQRMKILLFAKGPIFPNIPTIICNVSLYLVPHRSY